jgi:hypothetical protein
MTTFLTVLHLLGSDSGVFLVLFLRDEISELAASAGAATAARSDPNMITWGSGCYFLPYYTYCSWWDKVPSSWQYLALLG